MKKIIFTIGIILSSLVPFHTQAQKHEIRINALGALLKYYTITYERIFTNTGWANGVYFHETPLISSEYKIFSVTSEYRFYFKGNGDATGYFVAPYLSYRHTSHPKTLNKTDITRTSNGIALGVTIGKKWAKKTGFTYGTHLGIGRYLFDEVSRANDQTLIAEYRSKKDLRFGINLGFRF